VDCEVRTISEVLHDIASFDAGDDWRPLDGLLAELFTMGQDLAPARPTLFGVFERFPDHDGYGVMWSVLHGIEAIRNYEIELLASIRRLPTEFGVVMLRRLVDANPM
jgi:hypothetical protein